MFGITDVSVTNENIGRLTHEREIKSGGSNTVVSLKKSSFFWQKLGFSPSVNAGFAHF